MLSHGWALILRRRFRSADANHRPTRSILLKQLWSPWRIEYILNKKPSICVFCEAFQADASLDRDYLIVHRGTHASVIMNLYPYNNGHLMIVPYAHVATLEELDADSLAELMALTQLRSGLSAAGGISGQRPT